MSDLQIGDTVVFHGHAELDVTTDRPLTVQSILPDGRVSLRGERDGKPWVLCFVDQDRLTRVGDDEVH